MFGRVHVSWKVIASSSRGHCCPYWPVFPNAEGTKTSTWLGWISWKFWILCTLEGVLGKSRNFLLSKSPKPGQLVRQLKNNVRVIYIFIIFPLWKPVKRFMDTVKIKACKFHRTFFSTCFSTDNESLQLPRPHYERTKYDTEALYSYKILLTKQMVSIRACFLLGGAGGYGSVLLLSSNPRDKRFALFPCSCLKLLR